MSMSGVRDPFGQALDTLRRFAQEGRFGWGEPIVVKDMAAELGLSQTPVREALAWMSGEGLIERRRGRGYNFPALTAPDVVDLFELEWSCVHAALALHRLSTSGLRKVASLATAPELSFRELFTTLVGQTSNAALVGVHRHALERLRPIVRVLEAMKVGWKPTSREVASAAMAGEAGPVLDRIADHHRQRCELAGEIARRLQRSGV